MADAGKASPSGAVEYIADLQGAPALVVPEALPDHPFHMVLRPDRATGLAVDLVSAVDGTPLAGHPGFILDADMTTVLEAVDRFQLIGVPQDDPRRTGVVWMQRLVAPGLRFGPTQSD